MNFIKALSLLFPQKLLPNGTKMLNGQSISLTISERRELLERRINHHTNRLLDTYSPIRISIRVLKESRLQKVQCRFYRIIGEIALTHAGIEQDLKNTLIVDWEIPEKKENKPKHNLEYLNGKRLKKLFLELLQSVFLPEEYFERYKNLCDDFENISETRNDTLKAVYSFNQGTAAIFQVHEKEHAKYDTNRDYEEWINAWMSNVEFIELEGLKTDLHSLRRKFMNLRAEIFSDKIKLHSQLCSKIGKAYPAYAFKNPYRYQKDIQKQN